MDKIKSQTEFFDRMKYELGKSNNPSKQRFDSYVYSELIRIGVTEEEQAQDVRNELFELTNLKLKNLRNIKTFFTKGFQWFINQKNFPNIGNAIKLYIPLDAKHLCPGAEQLFTYMDKENIPTQSKIRPDITFDNVVVRVKDIKDAEKVIEYVKNNSYIQEGLLTPNPFAINKDNIVITMDGLESYNSRTSDYISNYIWNNKDNLNNINMDTFKEYLKKQQEKLSIDSSKDRNFDLKNITDILLMSVNDNTNDYEKFRILSDRIQKGAPTAKEVLDFAINLLISKYGINIAKRNLVKYIETGNSNMFSRDHKSREKIKINLTPEIAKGVVEANINSDKYEDYIEYLLNVAKDERVKILNAAASETLHNYGKENPNQLIFAIKRAMSTGDYTGFTKYRKEDIEKKHNYRLDLIANVDPNEILDLVKRHLQNNGIDYNNMSTDQILGEYNTIIGQDNTLELNTEEFTQGVK